MPNVFVRHKKATFICDCGKGHTAQNDHKLQKWMTLHRKFCDQTPTGPSASLLTVIHTNDKTLKVIKN